MPVQIFNGVQLYYEMKGEGEPLILVHGSWGNHENWISVVNELSESFKVVTYDRRGHSQSERPPGQGSITEDVGDLVSIVESLSLKPAHIAGNSGGASVVLKTAAYRPDIFRTLIVHEPPLFDLLNGLSEAEPFLTAVQSRIKAVIQLIEKDQNEAAAKLFVETIAMGPGAWDQLPLNLKETFIYNARTFLDEIRDPENMSLDRNKLYSFNKPALLSQGSDSPPFFHMVLDQLSAALSAGKRHEFKNAGHVPHLSSPTQFIDAIKKFCFAEVFS